MSAKRMRHGKKKKTLADHHDLKNSLLRNGTERNKNKTKTFTVKWTVWVLESAVQFVGCCSMNEFQYEIAFFYEEVAAKYFNLKDREQCGDAF